MRFIETFFDKTARWIAHIDQNVVLDRSIASKYVVLIFKRGSHFRDGTA
jgi:hypothetical protein